MSAIDDKKTEKKKQLEEARALKAQAEAEKKRAAAEKKAAKELEKAAKKALKEQAAAGKKAAKESTSTSSLSLQESSVTASPGLSRLFGSPKRDMDIQQNEPAPSSAPAQPKVLEEAEAQDMNNTNTEKQEQPEKLGASPSPSLHIRNQTTNSSTTSSSSPSTREDGTAASLTPPEPTPTPTPSVGTSSLASHASEPDVVVNCAMPESDFVPLRARGYNIRARRTSTHRISLLGAPAQRPPSSVRSNTPPLPTADSPLVTEVHIIEDPADEEVGSMTEDNANENAEYLASAIKDLREIMTELYAGGTNAGYISAYQALAYIGVGQAAKASVRDANRLKNRYNNITAFDHSRVVLPIIDGDPDSDYVNANYIDGYKKPKGYIASQGPVPNSFISFWRMVWHTKAEIIVMVSQEIEGGRMKCHRYWPDPTSSPPNPRQEYGEIVVTHVLAEPHKHYIMRQFEMEHNGEKRTLRQFACLSWPDHGVPLTTMELLGFRNAVKRAVEHPDAPIVIHCSAGVGRTGTYIAIDNLIEQCLDRGGPLNVDEVVIKLRKARNYMVQTEVQYMFIYRAVVDALSELLMMETKKKVEAEAELTAAAEKAAKEKELEDAEETKAIAEAQRTYSELGPRERTAVGSLIMPYSIKDRMQMLIEAQTKWLENYRRSLEEWNQRNQYQAEEYDLTSTLTPMQSRLEALRQKGLLG